MVQSQKERPLILIVEDEFLIRAATAEAIRDAGFEVLEASTADDAIAILENRRDIRVVFTDLQMPGSMDGARLAHAVRNRWPPIHIIATSGQYGFQNVDLPKGAAFFPKPYSPPEIARHVCALIGFSYEG
jgi:two-component system, response regulator PdtaR